MSFKIQMNTYNFMKKMETKSINWGRKKILRRKVKKVKIKSESSISKYYRNDIKKYWTPYIKVDTAWHEWFTSRNNIEDVRYIPEDVFYNYILPYYNDKELSVAFSDKGYSNLIFNDIKRPSIIAKNINGFLVEDKFTPISYDDMISKASRECRLIIKPSIDSGGGKGIIVLEADNKSEMKEKLLLELKSFGNNYVIQNFMKQHEVLEKLNPTSVNTIRIMSFLNNKGVNILESHIRIGRGNSKIDHFGIMCGINDDGRLQDFAIEDDFETNKIFEHPEGYNFSGVLIPGFDKIKELIVKEHRKLGHFRIVSWDFAVSPEGDPVLVEVNLKAPGIIFHQLTSGPLFGDLTNEILNEVFNQRT